MWKKNCIEGRQLVHSQNSTVDFNTGKSLKRENIQVLGDCGKGSYILTYERYSKIFLIYTDCTYIID